MIKSIPNLVEEKKNIPDFYTDKSNIYSQQEGIILRWLELNYECVFQQQKRLTNFEVDLKNSLHFAAAIRNYVGKSQQKFIQQMKRNCVSDEDYIYNADKLFLMLDEIGLVTHYNKKDLIFCNQRDNIIFLTQLMQALPHYIPKDQAVIFSCILGQDIIKEIELSNPTNKTINYWVNYEGHSDFSIKDSGNLEYECIRIEPKQSLIFKIKFQAKISVPVEGRLTFTNKKDGTVQASALVFELISQVNERLSISTTQCTAKLYQCCDHQITVNNIFVNANQDADFQIIIINESSQKKPHAIDTKKKPKTSKKKQQQEKDVQQFEDTSIPDAFFIMKKSIQLKRGESQILTVQFMPFKLENFKCYIIFQDLKIGEFQHEIIGITDWPEPEEIRPASQLYVDQIFKFDLYLPIKNNNINILRRKHENRLLLAARAKERETYLSLINNLPQTEYQEFDIVLKQQNQLNVTVPNTILLYDSKYKKLKDDEKNQSYKSDQSNKLPVTMIFKNPIKEHNFQILVKNKFLTDIRIYKIFITIIPRPIKATLELKVPFGDEIKQDIPIINNTDKDVIIKATLEGDPSFFGPREFAVKKGQTGFFSLTFKPQIAGSLESKLILINPVSNDLFEFKLNGTSEEPIATDHIYIKCVANQTKGAIIPITNKQNKQITYLVETDLINPEGAKKVTILPGKTHQYNLKVTPLLGGIYNGSITFIDENNPDNYIWYTVQLDIDRPPANKKLDITTQIRKAVVFEIQLSNPENEDINFEVLLNGDGLFGEDSFQIPVNQSRVYQLMFIPLKVQRSIGFLSFMSPKLSEIWYELNLIAEPSALVYLNNFVSEIGKSKEQQIYLENPSNQEVKLSIQNLNQQNFDVIPKDIVIKPYGQTQIIFKYTPTLVNVEQQAQITLSSNIIGDFNYQVTGYGLPPTEFNEQTFTGVLNKELQLSIDFKNPYQTEIYFTCFIENDEKSVFSLIGKKQNYSCKGNQIFQVPFTFKPTEISEYKSLIIIKLNDQIQWKFPIRGITELNLQNTIFNITTVCRQTLIKNIDIYPPGIPEDISHEELRMNLVNIPEEYNYLIQNCFQIKPIQKFIKHANDNLVYEIQFQPNKPFKCNFDLMLIRPNGGQWKYKLQLNSLEPEDIDIINIESCLNKTSSVSFKLHNKLKQISQFKAYFTKDSDSDFSISPQSGELNAYGASPTQFIVQFTPKEFKAKNGRIIIETQDHYWSYTVKGSFQNYKPPNKITQSKIQLRDNQKEQDQIRSRAKSPQNQQALSP